MSDCTHLLDLYPPVEVFWQEQRQELSVRGMTYALGQQVPFAIALSGQAALEALRQLQTVLERVDIAALERTKPRDLQ